MLQDVNLQLIDLHILMLKPIKVHFCQTPDLGQGLEFDFTFAMEQEQEPHPNF